MPQDAGFHLDEKSSLNAMRRAILTSLLKQIVPAASLRGKIRRLLGIPWPKRGVLVHILGGSCYAFRLA
jgi:hypothetical protein